MNTPEQKLKTRIMRKVYGVWVIRFVAPRFVGSVALVVLALRVTADKFFVAKILQNFDHVAVSNIWAMPQFIASALNHAEPFALVLIAVAGIGGFAIAVNLFRNIRSIVRGQQMAKAVTGGR